ncbi:MAG: SAM-dependent methyltransferase, partial [Campylobacterota bacterium]|nr:SAM-dependent methyltransferase [Campylobacterota bacterium]
MNAIKEGIVLIDGKSAKASTKVNESSFIEVQKTKFYVSRAAQKLEGFLAQHPIALETKIALDIGSSTGGFAQILLEHGVGEVDCVDVGSNQLHHTLRANERLNLYEETDIRAFKSNKNYDIVTSDVSFISILQIIDDIDRLASRDIIILYKPQFEVGKKVKRDRRGVVMDQKAIEEAKDRFIEQTQERGWRFISSKPSTLAGKDGNLEYLYHFCKQQ